MYSNTEYYISGLPVYDSVVDQYKTYLTKAFLVDSRIVYTEPIGRGSYLGIDYGVLINNTHSDQSSYNKSQDGKYDLLDSSFSNNYRYDVLTQRGGLAYTLVSKKVRLGFGNDIAFSSYSQRDLVADTGTKRDFINWYPKANLSYNFNSQNSLWFFYNGYTSSPSLEQLQPIANNDNPLNVVIGNPGLKPAFGNTFNLRFNSWDVLSERSINTWMFYSFTSNAISNSSTVNDTTGKTITQAVNVNGNYRFGVNLGYGFKWKWPNVHLNFNLGANQTNNVTIVDNFTNTTQSATYTAGMGIWKSKEKRYDLSVNGNVGYTSSKSSDDPALTTHYFTFDIDPGLDVYLPWHIQIHGDADLSIRQKTPVFNTNNNVYLVNGWLGKKLLKNDQLLIKAAVNDLLNQNIGFDRNVSSSFITQNTYSTIKRYFLFSIVWNFTKAGIPAQKSN